MAFSGTGSGTAAAISLERNIISSNPGKKVAVLYYLCRNGQFEHPHFMEVTISSPRGLLLKDVIDRLNVLRGNGMAGLYSWSCKRGYKNGFVWNDLSESDLILPVHGHEYVLKGSEIPPPVTGAGVHLDWASKPSDKRRRNLSCGGSIDVNSMDYKVYKADVSSSNIITDASTQTEHARRRQVGIEIVEQEKKDKEQNDQISHRDEIEITPPQSESSSGTLDTLMKSDAGQQKLNSEVAVPANNGKSSNLLQLICGPGKRSLGHLFSQYKSCPARGGGRVKLEIPTLKRSSTCHCDGRNRKTLPADN